MKLNNKYIYKIVDLRPLSDRLCTFQTEVIAASKIFLKISIVLEVFKKIRK